MPPISPLSITSWFFIASAKAEEPASAVTSATDPATLASHLCEKDWSRLSTEEKKLTIDQFAEVIKSLIASLQADLNSWLRSSPQGVDAVKDQITKVFGQILTYFSNNCAKDSTIRDFRTPLFEIANALALSTFPNERILGLEILDAVHNPVSDSAYQTLLENHTAVFPILDGIPWDYSGYVTEGGNLVGGAGKSINCISFDNTYLHLILGIMPYDTRLAGGSTNYPMGLYGHAVYLASKPEFKSRGMLQNAVIPNYIYTPENTQSLGDLLAHYGNLFAVQAYNNPIEQGLPQGHAFIVIKLDDGYHVLQSYVDSDTVEDYGLLEAYLANHSFAAYGFSLMDVSTIPPFSTTLRNNNGFIGNLKDNARSATRYSR